MTNGAPLRGALPMTGLRVMPPLRCENNAGGRFTTRPGPDSHGTHRVSADAAASYAFAAQPAVARRAAQAEMGATPQAEGLVRARSRVCFHNSAPALQGSLPVHGSLGGKAIERRWERGGSTDRAVPSGSRLVGQGRGPGEVRDAPSLGHRPWPASGQARPAIRGRRRYGVAISHHVCNTRDLKIPA